MTRVIVVATEKGGVGKTTTTLCLAAGLEKRGYKVLTIDLDPQRNTTSFYEAQTEGVNTMYDVYMKNSSLEDAIQHTENGDIVPNDKELKGRESYFETGMNVLDNYKILKNEIKKIQKKKLYDYIVMDTPPNVGFYMSTGLIAADRVIVPFEPDRFSIDGFETMLETVRQAKDMNKGLKIAGALLTGTRSNQSLDKATMKDLPSAAKSMNFPIFKTTIRSCQEIRNSQYTGETIYKRAPKSTAAADYNAVIDQLEEEW